jgi:hypothetical protein
MNYFFLDHGFKFLGLLEEVIFRGLGGIFCILICYCARRGFVGIYL